MLRPGDELVAELGRAARLHGLDAALPHRQRRLPGLQPRRRCASSARKASRFQSHLDGSSHLLSPERSIEVQMNLGRRHRHGLRRVPALPRAARGGGRGHRAHHALGRSAAATAHRRRRPVALRDRPGRRPPRPARAERARDRRDRLPRLRDRRPVRGRAQGGHATACSTHLDPILPADEAALPDGRGHARGPRRGRGPRASTCSTACCRRATRATASSSRAAAGSPSATRATATTRGRPTPSCACSTCRTASRAYLRHLHLAGEMTAATLITVHNLLVLP